MSGYKLIAPGESLDYSNDWTNELQSGSPEDGIASSEWAVTPQSGSPAAPALTNLAHADGVASVKISGTVLGEVYRLINTVTTTQGLTLKRTIVLRCGNR